MARAAEALVVQIERVNVGEGAQGKGRYQRLKMTKPPEGDLFAQGSLRRMQTTFPSERNLL